MSKNSIIAIISYLLVIIVGALLLSQKPTASWHMIDVNFARAQGDANLLINDNVITMIDGGYKTEAQKNVVPYLKQLKINTVDHFFISHPHRDHYEGMEVIQNAGIKINNVYYSLPPENTRDCCFGRSHFLKYLNAAKARGAQLHQIGAGFNLDYPNGATLAVLHAEKAIRFKGRNVDVNDMSLIMKYQINDYSVLFAGDLNTVIGGHLANNEQMQADILKVPHHGGYGIAPNAFFTRVSPQLNMVPGPKWIWLSDRGRQARRWSEINRVPYCVNGINGTIKIDFASKITVTAQRPDRNCKNGQLTIQSRPNPAKNKPKPISHILNLLLLDT